MPSMGAVICLAEKQDPLGWALTKHMVQHAFCSTLVAAEHEVINRNLYKSAVCLFLGLSSSAFEAAFWFRDFNVPVLTAVFFLVILLPETTCLTIIMFSLNPLLLMSVLCVETFWCANFKKS